MDGKKNNFKMENILVADSSFFRVFQFNVLYGDLSQALNRSNKIVLTETVSKKIFGNINPVGKNLIYNSTYLQNEMVEIGAVIHDLPHNSSWKFDGVLSLQTDYKIAWYNKGRKLWGNSSYNCYFKTNAPINKLALEQKITKLINQHTTESYKGKLHASCIPYKEVYFNVPGFSDQKHGNQLNLSIIHIIGVLILLLASFNYINLVTAQQEKKLRTIGVIKVYGGKRNKIIENLSAESFVIGGIVFLLVMFLSSQMLALFNELTESKFTIRIIFSGWNLILLGGIFLFTFLLSGIVSGVSFSRYSTVQLLRSVKQAKQKNHLRNGFLIFQFVLSIVLITSTLIIQKQSLFIKNIDNGFEHENIIYTNTNPELVSKINAFKDELKKIPEITDWTFLEEPIGYIDQDWGMRLNNKGEVYQVDFVKINVSTNFFDFFGIKLLKGELFSDNSKKRGEFIFNHTAIQKFKVEDLSSARILYSSSDASKGKIIAEVEDFHFESIHTPIRPLGFMHSGEADEFIYFKLDANTYQSIHKISKTIDKIWKDLSPSYPFEFRFLNDSWNQLYKKESQFQKILHITTGLSIFLSCLGLIGLTFFVIENRTKEIGIRKVNGAKTKEVMAMLNKNFIKWITIAFIIACPISYYTMNKWLQNFAYKTELSWWIFALAGIIAMGIALLTVSWQSWRAARRNPVESLRYE
jgi:putative ABC transport system permease protein